MNTYIKQSLVMLILGALITGSSPPAKAASAAFNAAVRNYSAHNYRDAITQFGLAEKQAPKDPSIHYYLGLCYQAQRQMSLATREFNWVAQNGTGKLRAQANTALAALTRYQQSDNARAATTNAIANTIGNGSANAGSGNAPAPAKASRHLKIMEFTTSWCHVCKQFEPIWQQTSSHMSGKADFTQYDAEDSSNAALVSRYQINAYPTFIFTDDSGNLLKTVKGGWVDANGFEGVINHLATK
jgi:thiol-disulfide isomerase/thioredoxin